MSERCEECDRADCTRGEWAEPWDDETRRIADDCSAHAVEWRPRCLAAESRADAAEEALRKVRKAIDTDPEIAPSDDGGETCHRCGESYDLADRDPAEHGMCWDCCTDAVTEIRTALATPEESR